MLIDAPGGGISHPQAITIASDRILAAQSIAALSGETVNASTASSASSSTGGVAASLSHAAGDPATLTVATYTGGDPAGVALAGGDRYVDLRVLGADTGDSVDARVYYSSALTGTAEDQARLQYFDDTTWQPVRGSGGADPQKDTTDNLDSTVSGGRFAVRLDRTSTPPVTALDGTVFALGPRDNQPPTAVPGHQVVDGGQVTLSGSGSDPDGDVLTYAWDLDGDGTYETLGQQPCYRQVTRSGLGRWHSTSVIHSTYV